VLTLVVERDTAMSKTEIPSFLKLMLEETGELRQFGSAVHYTWFARLTHPLGMRVEKVILSSWDSWARNTFLP
jgi:hypothetical protein